MTKKERSFLDFFLKAADGKWSRDMPRGSFDLFYLGTRLKEGNKYAKNYVLEFLGESATDCRLELPPIEEFQLSLEAQKIFDTNRSYALRYLDQRLARLYKESGNEIGRCYAEGIGVKEDLKKAFEIYTEAANRGNIKAMHALAECYRKGLGVEKNDTIADYCIAEAEKAKKAVS